MSFDYSGLLATATSLIADFGEAVTLRREATTFQDPSAPWEGPLTSGGDTQAIAANAVFFDLSNDPFTTTGAGIGRGSTPVEEHRARVLVEAASALPEEIGTDWEVDRGGRLYSITAARPQNPGGTLLYYELIVRV
jgi:hypothetical protein